MRRALLLGALWVLALGACVPGGCAARSTPAFGVALDGQPVTAAMINAARATTGLPVRLVQFYAQWPENPAGPVEDQFFL